MRHSSARAVTASPSKTTGPVTRNLQLPVVKALLAQCLALILAMALAPFAGLDLTTGWGSVVVVLAQGVLAAALGLTLKLDWWWAIINAAMPSLIVGAQHADLPPAWYLAAFVVLAAVYWTTFKTRVPLYLTSHKTVDALLPLLPRSRFRALDVGSGTGTLLRALAPRFPESQFAGIEAAPIPFVLSRLLGWRLRGNCQIIWGDFWKHRFDDYDLLYAFLSPVPMSALWRKACEEMRPGSMLISNSFAIPGVTPWRVVEPEGPSASPILVYRIP